MPAGDGPFDPLQPLGDVRYFRRGGAKGGTSQD
jgi:hypothetical protein